MVLSPLRVEKLGKSWIIYISSNSGYCLTFENNETEVFRTPEGEMAQAGARELAGRQDCWRARVT